MGTITVVGDGAVGTAAAVALSSFFNVTLAGPPGTRAGDVELTVEGYGKARIPYMGLDAAGETDMVIAALKAFHIRDSVPYIEEFCRGAVICLSNGMGLEEEWGSLGHRVEYSVLTAGFRMTGPFSVSHSPAELYCLRNGMAETLFKGTFLRTESLDALEDVRWAKWYANSIINPLGALTGKPNNEIKASVMGHLIEPLGKELEQSMPSMNSVILGKEMLNRLLENSTNHCSMLQDTEAGRKTEIDFLTGYGLSSAELERPLCLRLVNEIKLLS